MVDRYTAHSEDFEIPAPPIEILEAMVRRPNGDLFLTGPGGEATLRRGTNPHARYECFLKDAKIRPSTEAEITWEERDRLLEEVVRGIPAKDSKVRQTLEVRRLRRSLRRDFREARREGWQLDPVKDNE